MQPRQQGVFQALQQVRRRLQLLRLRDDFGKQNTDRQKLPQSKASAANSRKKTPTWASQRRYKSFLSQGNAVGTIRHTCRTPRHQLRFTSITCCHQKPLRLSASEAGNRHTLPRRHLRCGLGPTCRTPRHQLRSTRARVLQGDSRLPGAANAASLALPTAAAVSVLVALASQFSQPR